MTAHVRSTIVPARNRKESAARLSAYRRAGIPTLVDAAPVRAHIMKLGEIGVSPEMIARQVGVTPKGVLVLRDGTSRQARIWFAQRVMRANHMPHPSQDKVLPVGAVRRIRALQALGWPAAGIAERVGVDVRHLRAIADRNLIRYQLWASIRDVYEELSATPGPSKVTANRVQPLGYLNPFEWEGYDIDDPRVTPPRSARRTADRSGARADRLEQVADLTAQGLSAGAIADQLGVSARQVQRDRSAA